MLLLRRCFLFTFLIFNLIGCTSLSVSALKKDSPEDRNTFYIKGVPFVKQNYFHCGPASLTSVLGYWGKDKNQREIARDIYLSKAKGTFNFEMADFAQKNGFFTKDYAGTIEDIKFYIRKNIPVLALQKKRVLFSDYHYVVIIGINETDNYLVVNDGYRENVKIGFKDFSKNWQNANNWMLILAPPERVDFIREPSEFNRLGIIFEEKGNLELARENYLKAISLDGSCALFYFNLANAYLKAYEFSNAIENYKRAIALSPDFADCYNNLAYALTEGGFSLEEARLAAKRAIELNPEGEFYYKDTLGLIDLKEGKFEEAMRNFEESIGSSGEETKELNSVYKHLIESYIMLGLNR